ncbi:MAG: flagellar motor protein MotB [Elusimicrobiota bacterium]|nr:flagellar motor protein MotB [Elusimicrobiota bacterium]
MEKFTKSHHGKLPPWSLLYSDLMTTLMIFFLVLFVYSNLQNPIDYNLSMESVKEAVIRPKVRRKTIKEYFEQTGLLKFSELKITNQKVKLILPEPIVFKPGSAELSTKAKEWLHIIAELLRQEFDNIIVEGHTHDRPTGTLSRYKDNWELSVARANSVIEYLAEVEQIEPLRMSAYGYAHYRPIASNLTQEGRALNRRIEISLLREKI